MVTLIDLEMTRDEVRIERIQSALEEARLDAIICTLPINVLLISGYWPVVGASIAIATRDGRTAVIAPKDEMELAMRALADEVRQYQTSSLEQIGSVMDAIWLPLREAARDLLIERGRIGYERGPSFLPVSYTAMHLYDASVIEMLSRSLPTARLVQADNLLARLRATPTPGEAERIRAACRIAERAFDEGARQLREGMKECGAASLFSAPLFDMDAQEGIQRTGGFVFCMSGINSASAHTGFARTRNRELSRNDLVMVHCNSYADGYWTDITRTFTMGEADERKLEMYGAVFAASRAALDAIAPGARGADIDRVAREAIASRGFGEQFKHATGHGVGFAAIDKNAMPRLHPDSDDVLEAGMIFNIEPAIYIEGYGGLRHCDMVMVTETGAEVLTPFQSGIEHLMIRAPVTDKALEQEPMVKPASAV
jgi:Xaa-Pro aminopeptidase